MIRYEINQNILPRSARLSNQFLKKILQAIEKQITARDANELSIAFIDDKLMRELNKTYRGKDKVTDVLSFEKVGDGASMGEIILSWPHVSVQAKENKLSFREEIKKLTVHGVLHLLGFEHENVSAAKAKKMFDLQEKILEEVVKGARH